MKYLYEEGRGMSTEGEGKNEIFSEQDKDFFYQNLTILNNIDSFKLNKIMRELSFFNFFVC
jgi:hypothetical protein